MKRETEREKDIERKRDRERKSEGCDALLGAVIDYQINRLKVSKLSAHRVA